MERLISSTLKHGHGEAELAGALRALDLSDLNVERARKLVTTRLVDAGLRVTSAEGLAKTWIRQGDFLLDDDVPSADFVLGTRRTIARERADEPHRGVPGGVSDDAWAQ